MISIRRFLLINLLLTVTVASTLTIFGNYYFDQKDIDVHLDNTLMQSAIIIKTMVQHQSLSEIKNLQKNLDDFPKEIDEGLKKSQVSNELFSNYRSKFQFQIWKNGKLVAHSPMASDRNPISLSQPGFSDTEIKGQMWRAYTYHDPASSLVIMVAEEFGLREQFTQDIVFDDIYIILWIYPICGILIWLIIGNGLSSLKRIETALTRKESSNLDKIDLEHVPVEIKPVVEEINQLMQRLNDALERERRFAADAAHELKTPLAALKTQAQLAMYANNEEQRNQTLQYLTACVDRSTHIVQQLLTLSRLSPEIHTISDLDRFNLSQLSAEIIAQLVPHAIEKNIELELDSKPEQIFITANIAAISILLRNLIDNAIRYTQEDGLVSVMVSEPDPDHVCLSVTDNGPGIPVELRNRVFERFFRILGNKAPGSGLGLAIVSQIVRLHHAQIELKTPENGKGLCVLVTFNKLMTEQSAGNIPSELANKRLENAS